MVYLLYDLLLLASAAVLIPYYLIRGLRQGKMRRGIRERLGFYTPEQLAKLRGRRIIWVHAVSVGETRAAVPLLQALKTTYPEHFLLLSNVTETGHRIARELPQVDLCLFFPFDLSWVVRRVLQQVKPVAIVIVETELWPNFIRQASALQIPIALVNGRISDRSFPRYYRADRLIRPILDRIGAFCMQSPLDARRIREMGAAAERVQVSGNLKFDMATQSFDAMEYDRLRRDFRLPGQATVWVAGSTHNGEDETVAGIYRQLVAAGEKIFLILVPRHPERCRTVLEQLGALGLATTLRSALDQLHKPMACGEVLLVDSIGEMLKFYALADLVFVGGSLVPVGGHNILEASLLGKPVLFGPHMHNFKEISRLLQSAGGGLQVSDGPMLSAEVRRLLRDPQQRQAMGRAGYELMRKNAGATEKTLAVLSDLLKRS